MQIAFEAAAFAAEKHRDQRRKNSAQEPYINHPLRVARNLVQIGKIIDYVTVASCLLHDTIEDTKTTYEEIRKEFGKEIADVVMEVTDDKSLSKVDRKRLQIKNAPHKSHAAKLVKLCDKLDNLSSLQTDPPANWTLAVIEGYFYWAFKVVEGLRGTNDALEKELDKIFDKQIPNRNNINAKLEAYYSIIN